MWGIAFFVFTPSCVESWIVHGDARAIAHAEFRRPVPHGTFRWPIYG
jgi:hypothetical protein